jgi:hypothetical protein
MRHLAALLACSLLAVPAFAVPAFAQTPPPAERVRGTIHAVTAQSLVVDTTGGDTVTIALKDPVTVGTLKPIAFSDIKPGSYVATTAMPAKNGVARAVELRVFPDSMRGLGEGHRPWDLAPGSTMTNATVSAEVSTTDGHDLTLAYKGGSFKVEVPPGLPILTPAPATTADLKPGAQVMVFASRATDGSLSASRVTVATNGVKLGM